MSEFGSFSNTDLLNEVKHILYPNRRYIHTANKDWDHPQEDRLEALVNELVIRKVYPEKSQVGTPAVKMAIYYGWDWHTYRPPLKCPHCSEDLRNHEYGPPFKRELGIIHDDDLHHYECPKCRKVL